MSIFIALIIVGYIHSSEKYLLSTYCLPGTVLSTKATVSNESPTEAYFVVRIKTVNKGINI